MNISDYRKNFIIKFYNIFSFPFLLNIIIMFKICVNKKIDLTTDNYIQLLKTLKHFKKSK